jgi:hypothetical protein
MPSGRQTSTLSTLLEPYRDPRKYTCKVLLIVWIVYIHFLCELDQI